VRIGYLAGSDIRSGLEVGDALIDNVGSTDLHELRTRDPRDYARLHVPPDYFEQPLRYDLGQYDLLLNLVTDADLNPRVLANLVRLIEGFPGRVVNPPGAVLRTTRDWVACACCGLPHVVAPRVLRLVSPEAAASQAEEAGLRFPAILRLAGTHTGEIVGLVERPDGLAPLMVPGKAHFLTEWIDFRAVDGNFRKYRFFVIGGEIVPRHLLISDRWNVHAADRQRFMSGRPALVAEERALIEQGASAVPPSVCAALSAIEAAIGLDFFGVDCAVGEAGELLLFEANATMNFFPLSDDPQFSYHALTLTRGERAFDRLLFGDR
jgi:glutathione synthase/RimK-type ligase-like ATP-grasp enzyme